jgi:ATP-dependent RNA helicase DDX5/DBP2
MVGIAETGSGKTLAFLLPGIVHAMDQEIVTPGTGPIVLVIAPTRELVQQLEIVSKKFGEICKMNVAAVYGGVPKTE